MAVSKRIWEVEAEFRDSDNLPTCSLDIWVEANLPETALRLARATFRKERHQNEKFRIESLKVVGTVDVRQP